MPTGQHLLACALAFAIKSLPTLLGTRANSFVGAQGGGGGGGTNSLTVFMLAAWKEYGPIPEMRGSNLGLDLSMYCPYLVLWAISAWCVFVHVANITKLVVDIEVVDIARRIAFYSVRKVKVNMEVFTCNDVLIGRWNPR